MKSTALRRTRRQWPNYRLITDGQSWRFLLRFMSYTITVSRQSFQEVEGMKDSFLYHHILPYSMQSLKEPV